jgi:hypothetical protein
MIRTPICPSAHSPRARPSFQLKQQQEEGARLDQQIAENLRRLGYEF